MASIAIKGSWVVGWGENGHEVIEDGVVVTKDDRISHSLVRRAIRDVRQRTG